MYSTSTSASVSTVTVPYPETWLILGCFTCLIFLISCFYLFRTTSDGKLYQLGGLPILSAWSFFSKRHDFMWKNLHLSGGLPFTFRVYQHRLVTISGPKGRKLFFNNPSLNVSEGYKLFLAGVPRIEDVDTPIETPSNVSSGFNRRLHFILQKDRIAEVLPVLLDDVNRAMLDWGNECIINPFNEVNDLVFKVTLRLATCEELCRDHEATRRIAKLYWDLEKSSTPTALLFPWFPSPARRVNQRSTKELYGLILRFVQGRRAAAGAMTKSPIDALIQKGDKDFDIITFVMGTLFAAVLNTGITSCWALLYLGKHGDWRQRAVSELRSMISAHSGNTISSEPFHKQLSSVPLCAWEDELPALDLIIRETIRLSISFIFLRRNMKTDIDADGVRIAKGDFMTYLAADVHMNEDIYSSPEMFDPGRYEDGRNEDGSVYFGYVGWGVGRHPCPGMRIAKLEIKIILAMLLLGYDYTVADEQGNQTTSLPEPNRNDTVQARPLGKPVYLKLNKRTESRS